MSRQVVEIASRPFLSSALPFGVDADEPADGKSAVRRLLENPQTGFPQRPHRSSSSYAIAIKSSWSLAGRVGASSRFIDSALK